MNETYRANSKKYKYLKQKKKIIIIFEQCETCRTFNSNKTLFSAFIFLVVIISVMYMLHICTHFLLIHSYVVYFQC